MSEKQIYKEIILMLIDWIEGEHYTAGQAAIDYIKEEYGVDILNWKE